MFFNLYKWREADFGWVNEKNNVFVWNWAPLSFFVSTYEHTYICISIVLLCTEYGIRIFLSLRISAVLVEGLSGVSGFASHAVRYVCMYVWMYILQSFPPRSRPRLFWTDSDFEMGWRMIWLFVVCFRGSFPPCLIFRLIAFYSSGGWWLVVVGELGAWLSLPHSCPVIEGHDLKKIYSSTSSGPTGCRRLQLPRFGPNTFNGH
jgi:hypothetical protein